MTPGQQKKYLADARKAAGRVSKDQQVIGEAADQAVLQLEKNLHRVSTGTPERRRYVEVVAVNWAKRAGAKLHKDLPMGAAGSYPPPMHDEEANDRVAHLITEMRRAGGSLGSFVAIRVDFADRWALISGEDRYLLHAKYVEGQSSKDIAAARGERPGTIDNKLTAAKKSARLIFEDLFDVLHGLEDEKEEVT